MESEVEPPPLRSDLLEDAFELAGHRDVAFPGDFTLERVHERTDKALRFCVQIGDGEIRARRPEVAGATVGEAALVRHADDEPLFAPQHRRVTV